MQSAQKIFLKKERHAQRKIKRLESLRDRVSNIGGLEALIFCANTRLSAIHQVLLEEMDEPTFLA